MNISFCSYSNLLKSNKGSLSLLRILPGKARGTSTFGYLTSFCIHCIAPGTGHLNEACLLAVEHWVKELVSTSSFLPLVLIIKTRLPGHCDFLSAAAKTCEVNCHSFQPSPIMSKGRNISLYSRILPMTGFHYPFICGKFRML